MGTGYDRYVSSRSGKSGYGFVYNTGTFTGYLGGRWRGCYNPWR